MADTKISALTDGTTAQSGDLIPIARSGANYYITPGYLGTTLLGSTSLTGNTVTTSQPVLNLSQTWNAGAVTFTGLKFNATDTASASGSLLLDLQVGGVSQIAIRKDGRILGLTNAALVPELSSFGWGWQVNSLRAPAGTVQAQTFYVGTDVLLNRAAAATLQLGAADAAAPVAQTLKVQGVVAGTTNTAGANFTIQGSQGTGTGAGGSIIFQVAPAGSSGTAQNAYATALTIASNRAATFAFTVNGATFDVGTTTSTNSSGLALASGGSVGWSQDGTYYGTQDVLLRRDAANTLALRNGAATPQAFHVYNTYSSAADYERAALYWSGNSFNIDTLGAGTGATNRPLQVTAGGQLYLQAGSGYPISFGQKGIATYLTVGANGMLFGTDNTYDIGASSANRPRKIYVANGAIISGDSSFGGAITVGSIVGTGGQIYSPSNGVIRLSNGTATDFDRLQFGGSTSSFPALKRSTTTLQVRLADDSAYAPVEASTVRTATAYTVATLPAAGTAGRRAYVTDATAPTFLGTLTGGGAVVTPVFDNGTAWVAG